MINNNTVLIEFLEFMLWRDPLRRPGIKDVIHRFSHILSTLTNKPTVNSPRVNPVRVRCTCSRTSTGIELQSHRRWHRYRYRRK